MRVRITRQPIGMLHGMALNYYRPGEVYDLPPSVAELLVMEKYAIVEMRDSHTHGAEFLQERRRRV
jgi:hypothetical protein